MQDFKKYFTLSCTNKVNRKAGYRVVTESS